MNWINVEHQCPPTDTPVYVIVQETAGGVLRDEYHVEIASLIKSLRFSKCWDTKSGVVRYWKHIDDLPKEFERILNLNLWERR